MMLGKLPLEKLGPEDGEESRPICRARAKNWKAREGGIEKDRGGPLDSVSLFLFEPL